MNLLHIENLYKEYGNHRVLGNVNLKVSERELLTVVGPSGCGKTTMLNMLLGKELPTRGTMMIDDKPVGLPNSNRGIVFQNYSLFPNMTVIENTIASMSFAANPFTAKLHRRKYIERAMPYLKTVRLDKHVDKYPHELSGGMKQRAAIVQALIAKPRILLMDEPFGALDTSTRLDIQLFLIEIWEQEEMTIFFVTHDLDEAIVLGSRLVVLSQFYTDDREEIPNRGAKVVADYDLSNVSHNTHSPESQYMRNLRAKIFKEGMDPNHLQHVNTFDLRHEDSFQSLTNEESKEISQ